MMARPRVGCAGVPYVPPRKYRGLGVTLCIVSHSAEKVLIGVADRMLSRADDRHQPPTSKIYELYDSVCCFYAGGVTLSNSIVQGCQIALINQFHGSKEECTVQRAAYTFRESYNAVRIREAANEILPRYFISGIAEYQAIRHTLPKPTIRSIERRITRWHFDEFEDVHAIIFGVDKSGPHIYEVISGRLAQRDSLGFAAIGADTDTPHEFLHNNQGPLRPFGEAVVLSYIAAAVAADREDGIGSPADVILLGPERGTITPLEPLGTIRLYQIYHATFVKNLGGLAMALEFGKQLKPDANLGIPMPPTESPNQEAEPQSLPESTHGQ
jgi:hypothetical protein